MESLELSLSFEEVSSGFHGIDSEALDGLGPNGFWALLINN